MSLVRRQFLLAATALGGAGLPAFAADSSVWPDRPIHLVIPFPPGGNSDALGRLVADRLRDVLKAPAVVVENRPGGTTGLGTEQVARAEPDGYTLLLGAATAFTVLPNLRKLNYDPANGFEFAGGIADYISLVTVRADLPVKTLADLIALAKQQPGKLTLGSAGIASVGHINGEIIKRQAGIDILHVPFKGSQDAATALMGGQVDMIIDGLGLGLARAGRARVLAAFFPTRHPELPDVPTLAEAGLKFQFTGGGWGVMAPKGTPAPIMAKLAKALEGIVSEADTREKLQRVSVIAGWIPGPTYRNQLDSGRTYYADLLKSVGIRNEG